MSYDKSYTLQLNSDLAEMLEHYVCALIHPTAKLEEYVNQGFKTTQQLQHDCAIHTAWIGIGVSIILGLLGLYWCWIKEWINAILMIALFPLQCLAYIVAVFVR